MDALYRTHPAYWYEREKTLNMYYVQLTKQFIDHQLSRLNVNAVIQTHD